MEDPAAVDFQDVVDAGGAAVEAQEVAVEAPSVAEVVAVQDTGDMDVEAQSAVTEAVAVQATVDAFHRLYYSQLERTWMQTYWMGTAVLKCPLDLWIYQEILHEVRPDLVVECGTYKGGSALFLAGICDLIGHGEVVTIDVDPLSDRPSHSRLHYLTGSSVSPEILRDVVDRAVGQSVLVILDSNHSCSHVLEELRSYRHVVSPGSYLIVEDTCVNGHPLLPDFGAGPMEAVAEFLQEAPEYIVDASREKLYLTFNPRGFLRRTPCDV